jgi:hypothetical protein
MKIQFLKIYLESFKQSIHRLKRMISTSTLECKLFFGWYFQEKIVFLLNFIFIFSCSKHIFGLFFLDGTSFNSFWSVKIYNFSGWEYYTYIMGIEKKTWFFRLYTWFRSSAALHSTAQRTRFPRLDTFF